MIAPTQLARPITDRFRQKKINRGPSPTLAIIVPWLSILIASLLSQITVIASAPIMPPLGFMALLAWRQMRPGLLPVWAGIPLGAFDDLFSGQPFGCAIMLWSLAIIVLDIVEARFPWRYFLLDWITSAAMVSVYLVLGLLLANSAGGAAPIAVLPPQVLTAILTLPIISFVVSALDKARLLPLVDLD